MVNMHRSIFGPLLGLMTTAANMGKRATTSVYLGATKMDHLLAFGDSYTFIQGTYGRYLYTFYTYNSTANYNTLMACEMQKNVTSSGGPNWIHYLGGCYGGKPKDCPKTGGLELWDFAFAGSDISSPLIPKARSYTSDLEDSIYQWDKYAKSNLLLPVPSTLITIWSGINDINASTRWTNITNYPDFFSKIMTKYFESVELLYTKSGYRNFLFMGLPPLEKSPNNVGRAKPQPSATQVQQFNAQLVAHLNTWKASRPLARTLYFDTYSFLNGVIQNAREYGITDTTHFCGNSSKPDVGWNYAKYGCKPINQYFWFNSGHITYPVHKAISDEVRYRLRFVK